MKITCDLCGSALQMNLDGRGAVCVNCGMIHSMERLKVKLGQSAAKSSEPEPDPDEPDPNPEEEPEPIPEEAPEPPSPEPEPVVSAVETSLPDAEEPICEEDEEIPEAVAEEAPEPPSPEPEPVVSAVETPLLDAEEPICEEEEEIPEAIAEEVPEPPSPEPEPVVSAVETPLPGTEEPICEEEEEIPEAIAEPIPAAVELHCASNGSAFFRVVRNLSFTVYAGERVAITGGTRGMRGSVLRMIAGAEAVASGELSVFGRSPVRNPCCALVEEHMRAYATVRQQILLRLGEHGAEDAPQRLQEIAGQMSIEDYLEVSGEVLPESIEARCCIAAALAKGAEIKLLNYPARLSAGEVNLLNRDLRRLGGTWLIAVEDPRIIDGLYDRIIDLDKIM